jgi:hypothetical protein
MTLKENTPTRIWIIGAGRFGRIAAARLKQSQTDARLTVVDRVFEKCVWMKQSSFDVVCMDGIDFLSTCLSPKNAPNWIIPAVPVHVALLWVHQQLAPDFDIRPERVPDFIRREIPHPMEGKNGEIYMSLADFICPDNCPEPEKVCTFTRKPRPYSLFERLGELGNGQFLSVVIRSRQLAPGVGGFTPEMLNEALEKVKNAGKPILFSSACRCHGVMNAFSLSRRRG